MRRVYIFVWAHDQWSRFYEDVDDAVPLGVRAISAEPVASTLEEEKEEGFLQISIRVGHPFC